MSAFDKKIQTYLESTDHQSLQNYVQNITLDGSKRLKNLILYLNTTTFWTDPASSKHHSNHIGGLSQHCLNVYHNLVKLNPNNHEQNFMLAFCHDLCKLGIYKGKIAKGFEYWTAEEMEMRTKLEEHYKTPETQIEVEIIDYFKLPYDSKKWKTFLYGKGRTLRSTYDVYKPIYEVDDQFPVGHGEKSIIVALQNGIELTEEEMIAIRWHMGFDDKNWFFYRNNVHKKSYALVKALQRADQDATHQENKRD